MSWRASIASIREQETGTPPQDWRANIMAVATARGHNANGWREAVRMIASDYGVSPSDWRGNVRGIAVALGYTGNGGWREWLWFIADNLAPAPPGEYRQLIDGLGRTVIDGLGRNIMVRGV